MGGMKAPVYLLQIEKHDHVSMFYVEMLSKQAKKHKVKNRSKTGTL